MTVNSPDMGRAGVWAELFTAALSLMAHLESQVRKPYWTFGGGTVSMLRIGHRQNKDIELFVPDPSTWASSIRVSARSPKKSAPTTKRRLSI